MNCGCSPDCLQPLKARRTFYAVATRGLRLQRRRIAALLDCLIDGGEADEAVDDAAGCVRLAEVETDELGDEIELGDGDEAPVEPADDDEDRCQDVQLLQVPSSVQCLYRLRRENSRCHQLCQDYV